MITIEPSGETATRAVGSIFTTTNRLLSIETTAGSLVTTPTQPLCLTNGQILAAGDLQVGFRVRTFAQGRVSEAEVSAVRPTTREETVYNLVLDDSENFVADGFVVRSKPPVIEPKRTHHH
ncbi:MAG: hypothetical protein QM811_00950 [Pirellulales bacterium]